MFVLAVSPLTTAPFLDVDILRQPPSLPSCDRFNQVLTRAPMNRVYEVRMNGR